MKTRSFVRAVSAWTLVVLMAFSQPAQSQAAQGSGLANVSGRAILGPANNPRVVIGIVISGSSPMTVLIRAVGPALASFGVTEAFPDPSLAIFDKDGKQVAGNDDWDNEKEAGGDTFGTAEEKAVASAAVGAFALPAGSRDACVLVTLQPGSYTAVATPSHPEFGERGTVLCEAYEVHQ